MLSTGWAQGCSREVLFSRQQKGHDDKLLFQTAEVLSESRNTAEKHPLKMSLAPSLLLQQ